jgi:hypothetical protein
VADSAVERDGVRCVPIYLWRYEPIWDVAHQVEVLLLFKSEGQVSAHRYVLSYRPIRYTELLACLDEVGFSVEASDYRDDAGRYEVVARRRRA